MRWLSSTLGILTSSATLLGMIGAGIFWLSSVDAAAKGAQRAADEAKEAAERTNEKVDIDRQRTSEQNSHISRQVGELTVIMQRVEKRIERLENRMRAR